MKSELQDHSHAVCETAVAVANVRELVAAKMDTDAWKEIDAYEDAVMQLPQEEIPVEHLFTDGLYTRKATLKAGTIFTTRIHLKNHPFVILSGTIKVRGDDRQWTTITGPHIGVTEAGTRRVIFAIEETVFVTFHATNETDPDVIARQVTYSDGRYAELGIAAARKEIT